MFYGALPFTVRSMDDVVAGKVAAFFSAFPKHKFEKGELLVRAEQEPPGVFYLVRGVVSQYDITLAGGTVVVNAFKPESFFPMSCAINNTPNHYFFEAATEVAAHIAPSNAAVAFARKNPDVLFDLLARVYQGADGILRRTAHLMGGNAQTRLQFELVNAACRFGEQQSDGTIFIPFSEDDLAKFVGLARETVSRHVQKFKNTGLVKVNRKGFVCDLDRLKEQLGESL